MDGAGALGGLEGAVEDGEVLGLDVGRAFDGTGGVDVGDDGLNIGIDKLHMTKNAAERVHDVARIKISGCDLVQQRRKENEILVTNQRHLYVRSARQPFVEVHCRVKPGKPATGNDYSSRLHPITANRNATRAINILLMVAIIQSFSHLFLKLFSVQISENFGFSAGFFMQRTIERSNELTPKLDKSREPLRLMTRTVRRTGRRHYQAHQR